MTHKQAFKFAILVGLLVCARYAGAADWSTETVVEETVYQTSHFTDTLQTIQIGKSDGRYYECESNWVIGKYPKVGPTIAYMGAIAVGHALITNALVQSNAPKWAVRTWELVAIGWSVDHVQHNFSIGIKAKM